MKDRRTWTFVVRVEGELVDHQTITTFDECFTNTKMWQSMQETVEQQITDTNIT